MKKINYLPEKGKIALVAPSFGCATTPYKERLSLTFSNFEDDGFTLLKGENIFKAARPYRSNTARKCAKEFMDAYLSDADAIISVGGGEVMCDILPYIDFKKISRLDHKWFMGFSDNTNLTFTLATIAEVPTIYGPCAPNYYQRPYLYHLQDALDLLMGKTKSISGYPYWERHSFKNKDIICEHNYSERKKLTIFPNHDVDVKGRLLGGCLDILTLLCGTKYDKVKNYIEKYKSDGFIWFLEACDLNPVAIKRAVFQLKEAGWFTYCKGFIIGRPLCYRRKMFGITHIRAFKEELKEFHVPLILDADLGHFPPSMPMITGALGRVTTKDGNIHIDYFLD